MRKFSGILLAATLVFGSFGGGVSAAGQSTLVPDATDTIQLVKSPAQDIVDDRKLVVEAKTKELPLLDDAMHVVSLPIRMENSAGEAIDLLQEDMTFTSSDESIFTVDEHMLSGKKIGSADLIIGFQGQEERIRIQVTNNFVGLQFEDERSADFYAFYARYFDAAEQAFSYMEVVTVHDEKTGVLKVYGIDWSKQGPYYIDFMVDNAMYAVEITGADRNKTKVISSDLAEVTLDTGDYAISQVSPQLIKQGAPVFDSGRMSAAFYYGMTPGDYVFNVSAVHEDDFYMVNTPVYKVEEGSQELPVLLADAVTIPVTTDFNYASALSTMYVCGVFCEEIVGDFATLNVTPSMDLTVSPVIANGGLFYQFDSDVMTVAEPFELLVDDQLTTTLDFGTKAYQGGSELLLGDVMSIKNEAGSDLSYIYDEAFNFYGGQLTFTNVADASETYTYDLGHFTLETIELPNTTGTFKVTFTIGEIMPEVMPDYVDLEDDWYYWADSAVTVATDYTWTIRYNAPILEETVQLDSVFVTDSEGYVVKGAWALVEGDAIYVYAPEEGYIEGETYYLCVRNTVQNIVGKSMKYNIKMEFVASNE